MFRKIFRTTIEETVLGRWARTNEKINGIKVYWANMDHCGTCGKEVVDRQKNTNHPTTKPKAIQSDKK
jgi:hypothetical protein